MLPSWQNRVDGSQAHEHVRRTLANPVAESAVANAASGGCCLQQQGQRQGQRQGQGQQQGQRQRESPIRIQARVPAQSSRFRLLIPVHIGLVHTKVPVSIRREEEMIAIGTEPRVTIEGRRIEAKTR